MIEDFFHLPPLTPMVHLELRIFENGVLRGLGETDSWKTSEVEILVTQSLVELFNYEFMLFRPVWNGDHTGAG
jgi:hypothetical protein